MDSSATLFLGVFFGSIGLGYFIYGIRQRSIVPWIAGVCLMLLPYFIGNGYLLILVAVLLMLAPKYIDF